MPEINNIIYFDNAASTKVNQEVIKVFNDTLSSYFANPSSTHKEGQRGTYLLNSSHDKIKTIFKTPNHEVIYTSGATESNNLAIRGYCLKYTNRGRHIITSLIEHPSVLDVFKDLEKNYNFKVTYLAPDEYGVIKEEQVKNAIQNDTIFVSVMAVNNETGAINDINNIAKLLKGYPKINFHVDAVQEYGKLDKSINYNDIDMITIGGHKIYGLIGSGLLLKRKNLDINPILIGGGQENGFRSGTSDLANFLALEKAIEFTNKNRLVHYQYVKTLYDKFKNYLLENNDEYELNSYSDNNPYIINFSTLTKKASVVVESLSNHNIMVSSISACHSSKEKSSYVIKAMGKNDDKAANTIRVSFAYYNTMEEVDTLIENLKIIIKGIKQK